MVQTLLVIGLVLLAAYILGRRLVRSIRGRSKPGCEKCGVSAGSRHKS